MIPVSATVEIHDKYQIELKLCCLPDPERPINRYLLESYFFLPKNLFIHAGTYGKDVFYSDLQHYIRFKTPVISLRNMSDGAQAPLAKLQQTMQCLCSTNDGAKVYQEHLKLFCSMMKSALRDESAFLYTPEAADQLALLSELLLKHTSDLLREFRSLRLRLQSPVISTEHLQLFNLADEFLSLTARKYLSLLWQYLDRNCRKKDFSEQLKAQLLQWIEAEIRYGQQHQFPSVPVKSRIAAQEIYRESRLKKLMASVLFLATSTRKDGILLENIVFGVAAGIAMAVATSISFVTQGLFFREVSIWFFVILVFAYMWKDRLKEWLKAYFYTKAKRFIFDYKTTICQASGVAVGWCKEGFSHIPASALPGAIRQLRHRQLTDGANQRAWEENIILYRKQMLIRSAGCVAVPEAERMDGVVDILRLNVRHFLKKMDDPVQKIFWPDSHKIASVRARRVYHINLVLKYHSVPGDVTYQKFTLVLSRDGLKRLKAEPVTVLSPC